MEQPHKTNYCLVVFLINIGLGLILLCVFSYAFFITIKKSMRDSQSAEATLLPTPRVSIVEILPQETKGMANNSTTDNGWGNLEILNQTEIPMNDPYELAGRLEGIIIAPVQNTEIPEKLNIGNTRKFWKLNVDSNRYIQTDAKLEYITPHVYFWVEQGIEFNQDELANLADEFENKIYPTNREIFGSEKSPGADGDVHLTIFFARDLGGVGGYFSSNDTLSREIEPYSNELEMFYLSADYTNLKNEFTYGVLAHEFQHMIHWNSDRNEASWVSEGLSELAVELNGYDTGGFTYMFALNPDLQLNFWPGNDQGDSGPHYGASYLFMRFLYQRFGEEIARELVRSPLNGFNSIDDVIGKLEKSNVSPTTSEQIFQDWSIANFLNGTSDPIMNDKYGEIPFFPSFSPTETLTCDNADWQERTVSQFGTDYIQIDCGSAYQIEINREPSVNILPVEPYSGDNYFWSNYGDESDMKLSQTFDFTNITTPISMDYWTWYDIESDYDYLYLSATENGENWEMLKPTACTEKDLTGANYGCGLNGKSYGWIKDTIDLSAYAGKKVTLQFEYITDMAVNGDGFLIDDISIEAINYFTDFEKDDGGWTGQGFVRIQNSLPQSFGVALIENGSAVPVEKIISTEGLNYLKKIENDQIQDKPTIVINGLTRFTYQPAKYRIRITRIN